MEPLVLIAFLAAVAVGAYIQTVAGFALGLIVMGSVTIFHLVPVAFTAVVISIISLFNTLLTLYRRQHHIQWRVVALVSAGMLPAIVAGVLTLDALSTGSVQTLHMLLAAFILIGGTLLMLKPHPHTRPSRPWVTFVIGAVGGLFGGMFSTAGPPMVYYMYRQPYAIATVRSTLLAVFSIATTARIAYVGFQGEITGDMLHLSLLSLPVVVVMTLLGRRYPPPFSDVNMRRFAFGLLVLLGLALLLT